MLFFVIFASLCCVVIQANIEVSRHLRPILPVTVNSLPSLNTLPQWISRDVKLNQASLLNLAVDEGRIVNGETATRGEFPFQAFMLIDDSFLCGGSLISTSWVLTAAHCGSAGNSFVIHLGAQTYSGSVNSETGRVVVTTTTKFIHPKFNVNNLNNDLALLLLSPSISTSEFIDVIRLPRKSDASMSFYQVLTTVSGWGLVSEVTQSVGENLQHVAIIVTSNDRCSGYYDRRTVVESTICGSGVRGSTCFGDSGGPMTFIEFDGKRTQLGVVSFVSYEGCKAGVPAGFARLTSFLGWINKVTSIPLRP